jgi:hypothetical protein
MKVKVRARVYDANEQPIMLILTDEDKVLIAAMAPEAHRYCAYPKGADPERIQEWMKEDVKPTGEPEGTQCRP